MNQSSGSALPFFAPEGAPLWPLLGSTCEGSRDSPLPITVAESDDARRADARRRGQSFARKRPASARRFFGVVAFLIVFAAVRAAIAGAPSCEGPDDFETGMTIIAARVSETPRIRAAKAEVEAAAALADQAGKRPNPSLSLAFEDFTGSGAFAGLGQAQTTAAVYQKIELGGLRRWRADLAERETEVEGRAASREGARLVAAARTTALELLGARARVDLAERSESLAREALATAEGLAQAGAASKAIVERARLEVVSSSLGLARETTEAEQAARRLSAFWGGDPSTIPCLGTILPNPAPRNLESCRPQSLRAAPAVAGAEAEIAARRAELEMEKASALPDLEVGAGLRHLAAFDDVSMVAGVNVEIPLYQRNEGRIDSASRRLFAAQERATAVLREIEARCERLERAVEMSREAVDILVAEAIPAARRTHERLRDAWRIGAASSLEALDAKRTLLSLERERIDALVAFHVSTVARQALLEDPIPGPANPSHSTED